MVFGIICFLEELLDLSYQYSSKYFPLRLSDYLFTTFIVVSQSIISHPGPLSPCSKERTSVGPAQASYSTGRPRAEEHEDNVSIINSKCLSLESFP